MACRHIKIKFKIKIINYFYYFLLVVFFLEINPKAFRYIKNTLLLVIYYYYLGFIFYK